MDDLKSWKNKINRTNVVEDISLLLNTLYYCEKESSWLIKKIGTSQRIVQKIFF